MTTFLEATHNDNTVARFVKQSGISTASMQSLIVILCNEKQMMFQRIIELELLCPKKIVLEGKTYRWDCPTELLPE